MKTIPTDQIIHRLKIDNPWWFEPYQIPQGYKNFTPRAYFKLFYPLVENRSIRRAVVLMGPRRVGKTVMLHHTIQKLLHTGIPPSHICYFSVDHPLYNGLTLEQLLDIYQTTMHVKYAIEDCYIFFDEIQYIREWERYLKVLVDGFLTIKAVVSGSAAAALRLKSQESGAGRFTDFLLPPLTFYEYIELSGKGHLIKFERHESQEGSFNVQDLAAFNESFLHYLNFGGYPEVIFSPEIQAAPERFIKNDVVDKVLLRDLPGIYGIDDIQELNALFTTLAFNTSSEISLEELSKNSHVAKNTIKRYIEYLQAAFLLRIIHRIDRKLTRFQRANFFKVYLTNPSIRSALFSPVVDSDTDVMGALAETAIFSQWFHSDLTQLHYARWKTGEVDIVYLDPKIQRAEWIVEVKWTDLYFERPGELKNVIQFCHANNLNEATVTTRQKTGWIRIENIKIEFIPASIYCYLVGYNIIQGKSLRKDQSDERIPR